jgi:hypothetical protein
MDDERYLLRAIDLAARARSKPIRAAAHAGSGRTETRRALGLEDGEIAGGRYARQRLEGEPPAIYGLIQPTMERLATRTDRDASRPEIEFYRRRDLIELLVPIT